MKNNTIDAKLVSAQVAIDNALGNSVIKLALTTYGYNQTKLEEGKALCDEAQILQDAQKKEYGDQYAATDDFEAAMHSINNDYMLHLKVARVALRGDRGAAEALQLTGRRKKTYAGWIEQAGVFYTNALNDSSIKSALSKFGIKEATLTTGKENVEEVTEMMAAQLKEKGEAQKATMVRDNALEELLDWLSDFVAIARIALEDDPQLLEVLGIVEPS